MTKKSWVICVLRLRNRKNVFQQLVKKKPFVCSQSIVLHYVICWTRKQFSQNKCVCQNMVIERRMVLRSHVLFMFCEYLPGTPYNIPFLSPYTMAHYNNVRQRKRSFYANKLTFHFILHIRVASSYHKI